MRRLLVYLLVPGALLVGVARLLDILVVQRRLPTVSVEILDAEGQPTLEAIVILLALAVIIAMVAVLLAASVFGL